MFKNQYGTYNFDREKSLGEIFDYDWLNEHDDEEEDL